MIPEQTLALIVLLPFFGAALNGLWGARLPRPLVVLIANGTILASFILSVFAFRHLLSLPEEGFVQSVYTWMEVGGLSVDIRFVFDRLSGIMVLVITGIGFLIHLYSAGYMAHDPSLSRYFAYLNLFCFAMLILVLGGSLPLTFVGWEGVGLCSYLLIGFWFEDEAKAAAGKKAFVVNRIGDFGFIVAMMILWTQTGTLSYQGMHANIGALTGVAATAAALMLFLGATGKSAQIPLFVWLPDAMAGPTPVSALIHAATMVTAGVYLLARCSFIFGLSPVALTEVAWVGAITALFAATIATVQNDIKKVLAYSTVSQLGFMFLAAGVGAYAVALFHVVTHAFFKACLFLGSGSVIHGMHHEQDMRKMGGLYKRMPWTCGTFIVATLAITGFPLLSGFASKDAILANAFFSPSGSPVLWVMGALAATLTAFYMWRLVFLTFFSGETRVSEDERSHIHESPWTMVVPLVVLAVLSVFGGVLGWPHLLGGHDWIGTWLTPIVGAPLHIDPSHATTEWLLMGATTLLAFGAAGIAWVLYGKQVHPVTERFAFHPTGSQLYGRLLDKWHVDELYDTIVVGPLRFFSARVLRDFVERWIIDGAVNFVGKAVKNVGLVLQVFHTGNIQRYIAIFAMGLLVLIYLMWPSVGSEIAMVVPK